MRIMADFQCPDGHVNEFFVDNEVKQVECTDCSLPAYKLISPVRNKIDPISGNNVGATMKWMKMREQKLKQEHKANSE